MGSVLIASIYPPNGNPQPGPKFAYKLAWFERLIAHAADLVAASVPVILAGDYNVVPTAADIYPSNSLDGNALIQPESRAAFSCLLDQGWTDARGAFIRAIPCGPSGTTNGGGGQPTTACAWIIFSYRPIWLAISPMVASIVGSEARNTPAIMRRPGSK